MKVGAWNYYESLNYSNNMFLNAEGPIGDGLLKPLNHLYLKGKEQSIEFNTLDMCSIEAQDAFIFFDYPNLKNPLVKKAFNQSKPMYLVLFETELIRPTNWNLEKHSSFDKIFTWNDDFVDNIKYFKLNFAHVIPKKIKKKLDRKKLCTLIAGNKRINDPLELYSKRKEAIHWFEKNQPSSFDFYGIGWDKYRFTGPRFIRALNRFEWLTRLLGSNYSSYRGTVESKRKVLEHYRFSICYENARDIPGYITEKIFDCLFAGCVPIYWGANNIENYIPRDCYIDMREFASYEALYSYLISMTDEAYLGRLESIESYIQSEQIKQFSSEIFVQTILQQIVNQ